MQFNPSMLNQTIYCPDGSNFIANKSSIGNLWNVTKTICGNPCGIESYFEGANGCGSGYWPSSIHTMINHHAAGILTDACNLHDLCTGINQTTHEYCQWSFLQNAKVICRFQDDLLKQSLCMDLAHYSWYILWYFNERNVVEYFEADHKCQAGKNKIKQIAVQTEFGAEIGDNCRWNENCKELKHGVFCIENSCQRDNSNSSDVSYLEQFRLGWRFLTSVEFDAFYTIFS